MYAALRSMSLEPDPRTLGPNAADFAVDVQVIAGPSDGPGEESFSLMVCAPEWLARDAGGDLLSGRHHLIINADSFSVAGLQAWIEAHLRAATGSSWTEVAKGLSRWAHREFEDYQP